MPPPDPMIVLGERVILRLWFRFERLSGVGGVWLMRLGVASLGLVLGGCVTCAFVHHPNRDAHD